MTRGRQSAAYILAALAVAGTLADTARGQGSWAPSGNLRASRRGHTGTALSDGRILIAGGYVPGLPDTVLATCELWSPSTGQFLPTGAMSLARRWHTATVLYDGRVLVAGGDGASGASATSYELWDPGIGAWSLGPDALGGARYAHTATRLPDGRVLLAGGEGSGAGSEIWDPLANGGRGGPTSSWPMVERQPGAAAIRLADGRVVVTGGGALGSPSNRVELWDVTGNAWQAAPSLQVARTRHGGVLLGDGRALVVGGVDGAGQPVLAAELRDPTSGNWGTAAALSVGRWEHALGVVSGGDVLVIGGRNASGALTAVERWRLGTSDFAPETPVVSARSEHTVTTLPGGRVLVIGGGAAGSVAATAELWTADDATVTAGGSLTEPRDTWIGTEAALLPDGRVMIPGGASTQSGARLATAEAWDPASEIATALPSMSVGRVGGTVVLLADGRVLVAGGLGSSGELGSAEVFDPSANAGAGAWSATGSLAEGRGAAVGVLLHDGRVLVVGGTGAAPALASAEVWDPQGAGGVGSFSDAGAMSAARVEHASVLLYDGRVLITGGWDGVATNPVSTELWDPRANDGSGRWSTSGDRSYTGGTLILLADGRAVTVGNYMNSDPPEVWSPATGTWSTLALPAELRTNHVAMLLPDGRMLIGGGYDSSVTYDVAPLDVWDPATDAWQQQGILTVPRYDLWGKVLVDGRAWLAGGNVTGGDSSAAVEVWSAAPTAPAACVPVLGLLGRGLPVDPWPSGATVVAYGARLLGCSEGSGGATSASPGDVPRIVLRSLTDGRVWDGRLTHARDFGADRVTFTVPGDAGVAAGYYAVQALVGGEMSAPRVVRIARSHEQLYLHRESTLGGATRDMTTQHPSGTAGGHVASERDTIVCRALGAAGAARVELLCPGPGQAAEYVYTPAGFVSPTAVSGTWTLRADVRQSSGGSGTGEAYLFARVKRHSDGALIFQSERLTSLNVATLPTTATTMAELRIVVPARSVDSVACPSATVPCASTTLPPGDRVRLEWWVDVVTPASRTLELALESGDMSTASVPLLTSEVLSGAPEPCVGLGLGEDCDDGDLCTEGEICDAVGDCGNGVAVVCDSAPGACRVAVGVCDTGTGACVYPPAPVDTSCSDADPCNGEERCDDAGVCLAGAPLASCGGSGDDSALRVTSGAQRDAV
ncbi:MAG: kelch repeat-containing protein, partial [Myxococcota bacterium]